MNVHCLPMCTAVVGSGSVEACRIVDLTERAHVLAFKLTEGMGTGAFGAFRALLQ